jgi:uncharacterized protein (DUF2267 family)
MATDYADFIATVARAGSVPPAEAERATRATLSTLAERISAGEAREIAAQLPPPLRELLAGDGDPQKLSAEEFLQRVQLRERVPIAAAEAHVRAVFAGVRETLSNAELADLASELPRPLEALLLDDELPEPSRPMPAAEFLARVARRAGLDGPGAQPATDTVLALLGARISGGETDDLIKRLPDELHAPLQRGRAVTGEPARWLPLKDFLIAVAELEGVTRAQARLHTRAVLETLREAAGVDELEDALSQLPKEYRSLVPRQSRES